MTAIWETLIAFLAGGIGGWFSPWIGWKITELKLTREAREKLIAECRLAVERIESKREFVKSVEYSRLRPYLSGEFINYMEPNEKPGHQSVTIALGDSRYSGVDPFKARMLDTLAALEKRWRLI